MIPIKRQVFLISWKTKDFKKEIKCIEVGIMLRKKD